MFHRMVYLYSGGGEGNGEESKVSGAACGLGRPPCVCFEEDSGWENKKVMERWNGTEGGPWAGCHSDWDWDCSDWVTDSI